MTLGIKSLEWRALTPAINQIPRAPRLLQDLVFKRRNPNASKHVDVDVVIGGRQVLPFVNTGAAGTIIAKLGREVRSVRPPRLRPKKPLTAEELLLQRGAGMPMYAGGGDISMARDRKIGEELADLKNRIDFTVEMMCAKALAGGFTVTQDDLTFAIDYNMPEAHKPGLTTGFGWNEEDATVDIMGNIDTWSAMIRDAVGVAPDIAICGKNVVSALRKNAAVMELLDNRRNQAGEFRWDATNDYMGNLNGIALYRYGQSYTDTAGSAQNFISDDAFILIATNARFSIEFALIEDLKAGAAVVGEYFAKTWDQEDPSAIWILAESDPLPVLWQPEAVVYADVIV